MRDNNVWKFNENISSIPAISIKIAINHKNNLSKQFIRITY
jgi:hypothetical protein